MARLTDYAGFGLALLGLGGATAAQAQAQAQAQAAPFAVAQASDASLGCSELALEMVKAANVMASAAASATAQAAAAGTTSQQAANLAAAGAAALNNADPAQGANQLAAAINQAQLNGQLASLQAQAARAGINGGTANAAIGGLAALAAAANTPGGATEAAKQAAINEATNRLASAVPGGALVGQLMGGFFKKKPKPQVAAQPVPQTAALAPAGGAGSAALVQMAQQRVNFLQSLSASKSCK